MVRGENTGAIANGTAQSQFETQTSPLLPDCEVTADGLHDDLSLSASDDASRTDEPQSTLQAHLPVLRFGLGNREMLSRR
jgi:hypothetical protein